MNKGQLIQFVNEFWDNSIVSTLMDYIKIPNKSPHFDRQWKAHGFMDSACDLIAAWCKKHAVPGMKLEKIELEGRTPILFIEIPGNSKETVLLYGHLDKQPEMTGWESNLGPWTPVLRRDRLYGRGAADDGYAAFASLAAIKALKEQNLPHARILILIEACEESGSLDLPYYISLLEKRIEEPSLVICLDSGCANYDQLWSTTSLRGLVAGMLTIKVLKDGAHSGSASGVTPSCFRILRQLLNRIENEDSGNIRLKDLYVTIPKERIKQANYTAKILKKTFFADFPFLKNVKAESKSIPELILRRTWKPALSVIGIDGVPAIENAGNVTLPELAVKLSLRLPPTANAEKAAASLKKTLEKKPPFQAQVEFSVQDSAAGWNAPKEKPWLLEAVNLASKSYFGKDAAYMGEGGSIPFMGMLGKKFPNAQFLITGVLGPESNAHGPNEFLHLPTGKKLTACVAQVIAEQFNSGQ